MIYPYQKLTLVFVGLLFAAWAWALGPNQSYQVHGMTCGGCERAIKRALEGDSRVAQANADQKTGKLTIEFKDGLQMSKEEVENVLKPLGYSLVPQK